MKNTLLLLITLVCISTQFGCKNSKGTGEKQATDLTSIRTLGIAYLEEFKLEEAEKEFLKFIDLAPKEKLGYANLGLTYLRMGKYPEAEKQLVKAIEIDPKDADIRLILATVYKMNDEHDRSVSELKTALESSPDHLKVLYDLSELYSVNPDSASQNQREKYLLKLIEKAPGNLVPYLNMIDICIRKTETDKAIELLEKIRKQFPEFPAESLPFYDKAISLLRKKDNDNAVIQFTIFHNYLKVTAPYQAGIMELKGPGGNLLGFPVITFDKQASTGNALNGSILDAIKFSDVTESAGLNIVKPNSVTDSFSHVEQADYDNDGDIDLYAGSFDPSASSYKHFLFRNDMGRFTDVSEESGIRHKEKETGAFFDDFDNDGFLDLFIIKEDGDILYRNSGNGKFEDVTSDSKAGSSSGGNSALYLDADHDGDLDLFEARTGPDMLYRNNGDGTFQEQSLKMGLSGGNDITRDAAIGDFDEDDDIDLIVVSENAPVRLFSNQRQGVFKEIAETSGLKNEGNSSTVAVSDYNNDGFLDLFIGSSTAGNNKLFRNLKDGRYEPENNSNEILKSIQNVKINDALFLDFDNDGWFDLLIAGESSEKDGQGAILLHNEGNGKFSDASRLLPSTLKSGKQVAVFDYNDDGDLDIAVAGVNGGITLLRNDGGNINHFVKIKLVGLRAGSAKNNHYGIGAKVEIRSGDLYQRMVVTDPNVQFGIGSRAISDIIRITWTNGVPQNIFFPGTDQALIEAQTLKGSCPFLYTWNGNEFVFVKDILWRSALGMPTGIMGGSRAYAFPDASDDYLRIPGEQLKPKDGKYLIQVTSELWETIYTDKIELVAVDHPDSVDVFVAEQFSPPPFGELNLYQVSGKNTPVSAKDTEGNDVLSLILEKDDKYISSFKSHKYQGVTEMQELIIDPGKTGRDGNLFLFMNGWIFPTDASINVALSQSESLKVHPPVIQVVDKNGKWVTVVGNAGFPMGKNKTVIVDLSGKFLSSDHRLKIKTNMEIYWDYIFFSNELSSAPIRKTVMNPVAADLHFRGFSAGFRKGGRYGPHWFDYNNVDKSQKWRDLTGNYTRYGDVLPLLRESDNKYIISNAGDEASIEFDAGLPLPGKGWTRDFFIRSVGWVKDGDINTALGNTVLPLPFHGMSAYPPKEKDTYPKDPELEKYNREYNTRIVTSESYLNALKK